MVHTVKRNRFSKLIRFLLKRREINQIIENKDGSTSSQGSSFPRTLYFYKSENEAGPFQEAQLTCDNTPEKK